MLPLEKNKGMAITPVHALEKDFTDWTYNNQATDLKIQHLY